MKTVRTLSAEPDDLMSPPKRLAVWLPLHHGGLNCLSSIDVGTKGELGDITDKPEREENVDTNTTIPGYPLCEETDNPFIPGDTIAENVRHLFVRSQWLFNQADSVVRNAVTSDMTSDEQREKIANWPLGSSKISSKELLRKIVGRSHSTRLRHLGFYMCKSVRKKADLL